MTGSEVARLARSLVIQVHVKGFRTLRDATFRPGPLSAVIGEPGTGKSNLLAAIRAGIDPAAAPLKSGDRSPDITETRIEIELRNGVVATPSHGHSESSKQGEDLPDVISLPARLRAGRVIDTTSTAFTREKVGGVPVRDALTTSTATGGGRKGAAEAAHGLVASVENWLDAGMSGVIVLIEEPELFLAPQTQRYLYRLLRHLSEGDNQVFYSTHSPSFLNVSRLEELVLTDHDPEVGTSLLQPEPLPSDEEFRAYSEFDATRSELFLARAAILVEGQTERFALPFVFRALGYDADKERISIIECGGKPNIPLVARVASAVGVPFLAVHDRDAPIGRNPILAEQQLNTLIEQVSNGNRIELVPDFEGASGIHGHRHKPARAWQYLAHLPPEEVPEPLLEVVRRAIALIAD